jgi:hypothetical protein
MIERVIIRNLKRFREQEFSELGQLHLSVGPNNAGKSTLLHALAIWNYCIEEFRSSERTGSKAIEIALANFTPLPLNDFKLLWHEKTERRYPVTDDMDPKTGRQKKQQEFIHIEVEVHWQDRRAEPQSFTVALRWHNRNTMYASPKGGWEEFRRLDHSGDLNQTAFPRIVYVPPQSNIAAQERPLDEANLRALVGEGRPGSVVRNLVWRAWRAEADSRQSNPRIPKPFTQLRGQIRDWFGVTVLDPTYEEGRSRFVTSGYTTPSKTELDWVNAGSGLLQCLIVLSFLYGFQPDVLLLDEPDAHLHVNLQRTLLDFLTKQSRTQMIIATHAEQFIQRVRANQISFLTPFGLRRVPDAAAATLALSEISNLDIGALLDRKLLLYIEGETDEACLRGWACALADDPAFVRLGEAMSRVAFVTLRGGSAEEMLTLADRHFKACRFLSDAPRRLLILDRNDGKWQAQMGRDEQLLVWSKRHIESYLLVPAAWVRAAEAAAESQFSLARPCAAKAVADFFTEQSRGLTVDWLHTPDELFREVNAKRMLFGARREKPEDGYDALTARLYAEGVVVTREDVSAAMRPDEIHKDVKGVFGKVLAALA